MASITSQELKLIIENMIPDNIKTNHKWFNEIFNIFFEYLSDTYRLGTDSHLLLETDTTLWNENYSGLNHVDLTGIKAELIKTYLHDYNIFFEKVGNDENINRLINKMYTELGIDKSFDASKLTDVINEEEFLIHKKFSQQKTISLLFNYMSDLVNKTGVGQFDDTDAYFKMYEGTFYNPRKAFAYTIDTSLFKTIYDYSIKPITHPLGFSYNYKHSIKDELVNFFNVDSEIQDFKLFVLEDSISIQTFKTNEIKEGELCYVDPLLSNTPQFKVSSENTLGLYGGYKTIIEGNSFIRTGDNTYKKISDGIQQFEGQISGCTLLDWNLDTSSYTLTKDLYTDDDIRKDLYGAIVNYNEITGLGDIYAAGVLKSDAYVDPITRIVYIKNGIDSHGNNKYVASLYLGVERDFITFKSTESMYSLEALKFDNYNDCIKIYSVDKDQVINPFGGSISFFITLLDNESEHIVWCAEQHDKGGLTHSLIIDSSGIFINEYMGTTSYADYKFDLNRRYHITVNWNKSGRNIIIDNQEQYLRDTNKVYNEFIYYTTNQIEKLENVTVFDISIPFIRKSLSYQQLNSYSEPYTLSLSKSFSKSNVVLFENIGETLENFLTYIEFVKTTLTNEIVSVQNDMFRKTSTSRDPIYVKLETKRVSDLVNDAHDYMNSIYNIEINIMGESIKLLDIIIQNDEKLLKTMFDNLPGEDTFILTKSTSVFEYFTEDNEIYVGNSPYFTGRKVCKTNYILDNFDIFNRPLNMSEIMSIKEDHDNYILSDEYRESDLELFFSLDRKIFEHYHNEMVSVDSCFLAWFIGDTYDIGLDGNLLLQYYNDTANCGNIFSIDDCQFGGYIDHSKATVDNSLEFNTNVVIYDNVVNVLEMKEGGKLKLVAYLDNNTRIEYVKGVYWRHINGENGTIIEEKSNKTIMDYSYQIKVLGTSTTDDTILHNKMVLMMGDHRYSGIIWQEKIEATNKDKKTRKFYNNDEIRDYVVEDYYDYNAKYYEDTHIIDNSADILTHKIIMSFEELSQKSFIDDLGIISDDSFISTSFDDVVLIRLIKNGTEYNSIDNNGSISYIPWKEKDIMFFNSCNFYNTTPQTFVQKQYDINKHIIASNNVTIQYQ